MKFFLALCLGGVLLAFPHFLNAQETQVDQTAATQPATDGLVMIANDDGKIGFINTTGKVVVNPQFDAALPYSEGLAPVLIGNNLGFVDTSGKMVINPKFSFKDEKVGMLSLLTCRFSQGFAVVPVNGKFGYINPAGQVVIPAQYDFATPFSEGLAFVVDGDTVGYIAMSGEPAFKTPVQLGGPFSQGLAAVLVGDKWGYINTHGNQVIEPQFDTAGCFSDGLAVVSVAGKYGFINKDGQYLVNPHYDCAWPFSEELGAFAEDGKIGFIDSTGHVAITPRFDYAPSDRNFTIGFSEGVIALRQNGRLLHFDKEGNRILDSRYDWTDWVTNYSHGVALVAVGRELICVDHQGHEIWKGPAPPLGARIWLNASPYFQWSNYLRGAGDAARFVKINLSNKIEIPRDVVRGEWSKEGDTVSCQRLSDPRAPTGPLLRIPYKFRNSYIMSCMLERSNTLQEWQNTNIIFPVGKRCVCWALETIDKDKQRVSGMIDRVRPFTMIDGHKYKITVAVNQVDQDKYHIRIVVDDTTFFEGTWRQNEVLPVPQPWGVEESGVLSFSCRACQIAISSINVVNLE